MTALTIAKAAGSSAVTGLLGRTGRAARDGCIAFTALNLHALLLVDQFPPAAMAHMAAVVEGNIQAPGAEEMFRVAAFGSLSLEAMGGGLVLAGISLALRMLISTTAAAVAAARPAREAGNG